MALAVGHLAPEERLDPEVCLDSEKRLEREDWLAPEGIL
jgi:hypothetical protein